MTRDDSETTSIEQRTRMVERQLRRRGIHDERVLAAMAAVPRERFVPGSLRRRAYRDGALRIGEGQTISQPWIVACMAQLLELEGSETVLEVGTGSGYGAAVLSLLCAQVVSVERFESLAAGAAELLAALGYDNVEVRVGDGSRGAPDRAPFGGISVTATARERPPAALFDQLAPGAALVCPVAARPPRGAGALPRRQRGGGGLGALRAAGERRVIREFSAGGVVVRRMRGRPFVAVVRVRDEILALPKGHPDRGRVVHRRRAPRGARGNGPRNRAADQARRHPLLVRARRRAGDEDRELLPVPLPRRERRATTTTRSRKRSGFRSRRRRSGWPTRASARWPAPRCPGWLRAARLPRSCSS